MARLLTPRAAALLAAASTALLLLGRHLDKGNRNA